jgi:hypothetical protein
VLKRLTLTFLVAIALVAPADAAQPKIPIVHSTDLLHPHDDPDDHYDLATVFALAEFDVRGIILDLGERQAVRPGRVAVEQMLHITSQKVPYAVGLSRKLRARDDKVLDEDPKFQGGIELLLSVLRASDQKVVVHTCGSCRDVAAALNREPQLFKDKVKALYLDVGTGPGGEQKDWNVTLDPVAYARLLESGLPLYWCPCHGKEGFATWFKVDQTAVVGACSQPLQNFFVYGLSKSKEEPIAFLTAGAHPVPKGPRNMWCTAGLLHAAGRKIYQRGADDFVALTPADAEKAGLSAKAVEVFQFLPMRASVTRQPQPAATGKKPVWPLLAVELNATGTNSYVFRATDSRYERVLASVLKNLLAELGR